MPMPTVRMGRDGRSRCHPPLGQLSLARAPATKLKQAIPLPFKEKAIVRHKLRADWGVGRILMRTDEYIQVDFSAGGLKKLKTSIADEHLEAATDEESRAMKPAKTKETVKRKVAPKTRMV